MAEAAGGGSRLNRVQVTIAGDEYNLRTDEPPKQLEKLAARVDRELRELGSRFPGVTRERLAVLLALRLTGQLERAREQARAARKTPAPGTPVTPSSSAVTAKPSTRGEAEAVSNLFDPPQGDSTL